MTHFFVTSPKSSTSLPYHIRLVYLPTSIQIGRVHKGSRVESFKSKVLMGLRGVDGH